MNFQKILNLSNARWSTRAIFVSCDPCINSDPIYKTDVGQNMQLYMVLALTCRTCRILLKKLQKLALLKLIIMELVCQNNSIFLCIWYPINFAGLG